MAIGKFIKQKTTYENWYISNIIPPFKPNSDSKPELGKRLEITKLYIKRYPEMFRGGDA